MRTPRATGGVTAFAKMRPKMRRVTGGPTLAITWLPWWRVLRAEACGGAERGDAGEVVEVRSDDGTGGPFEHLHRLVDGGVAGDEAEQPDELHRYVQPPLRLPPGSGATNLWNAQTASTPTTIPVV